MAFLIGTDEAGYGPNLGPLVVSASVWKLPDRLLDADLYTPLGRVISRPGKSLDKKNGVSIADSKLLYKPGGGLKALERGVLSILRTTHCCVRTWRDAFRTLDEKSDTALDSLPWYAKYDADLPCDADVEDITRFSAILDNGFEHAGISCTAIRSEVVFPQQLNDLIDSYGSKGTALSVVTLSLVKSLMVSVGKVPLLIHCDKHGARNKYGPLLQGYLTDQLVEVYVERREESVYRWGPVDQRVEIRFVAKGESCLASALASMTSKYLRELAMKAFNDFWGRHVPGLKPTAGYPVDARRFKADILSAQRSLAISDRILWRNR